MARYIDIDEYLKGTFCDRFDDCTSEEECFECWAKRNTEDVAPVVHAKIIRAKYTGIPICTNCKEHCYTDARYCYNCGAKLDKE